MNARFDDKGNFTVPPTEHARLRAEKLARPAGTRVTRVECDTCHHIQDFTHPTGPDAHLALNAVMRGQGWTKNGPAHTCRDCQQDTATLVAEVRNARALIARIREALAGHPRCDVHPDDDPISCGWMRAVASVQWALDTTEPTTEENLNA